MGGDKCCYRAKVEEKHFSLHNVPSPSKYIYNCSLDSGADCMF